jgi:hypothetical protein
MRFVTHGLHGSRRENAVQKYLDHRGLVSQPDLVEDPLGGLQLVKDGHADFLVQCSAHFNVHVVKERYFREIVVADTFIYSTRDIVLLEPVDVATPQSLGSVRAADGYLEGISYPTVVYEIPKPVVGRKLWAGCYDTGLTTRDIYEERPELFRIRKHIGHVLTTWIVFDRSPVFTQDVCGVALRGFYQTQARPAGVGSTTGAPKHTRPVRP